jgi:glycogen debranching enzyme
MNETAGAYHVLAASPPGDAKTRVLKHGDTFAVFDHYGDIVPGGLGEEGLYHQGTRFLSRLVLTLEGQRPFFLSSRIPAQSRQLTTVLTNPDVSADGRLRLQLGTLHIVVRQFLWQGVLYQRVQVANHGLDPVVTALEWHYEADFVDIFEVRGVTRTTRGRRLRSDVTSSHVVLGYRGLDDVERRTRLEFSPPLDAATESCGRHTLHLQPREAVAFELAARCQLATERPRTLPFGVAREAADADLRQSGLEWVRVRTSNERVNRWLARALADLQMLTTALPSGPYPYAGVPWFNTPFGRDGLVTALQCLWLNPALARGVLAYLASTQATELRPDEDAEPGKILHETRRGELAACGEIPFGRYYGSVDSTPLFVVLAGAYWERTGDEAFLRSLWPAVESALDWIDRYGDSDGDGFVEYQRQAATGLLHQGWKDNDDAIVHEDGTLAEGPVALCEVQAYVYAARLAGASVAATLGMAARADMLTRQAATLKAAFDRAYWCDDLGTYALALDGHKRPCRVRTSNAGQCLFSGIATPERAATLARTLMRAESFSGWGIRTLAATERRYNPMGYHTGAVWPHDNALIALGLSRYGFRREPARLFQSMFQASLHFDLQRMPELFCGFQRQPAEPPVPYPVACTPQAWASGSAFLFLQACLGARIDHGASRIVFETPSLPAGLTELRIHGLAFREGVVDVKIAREHDGVEVTLLRSTASVDVFTV